MIEKQEVMIGNQEAILMATNLLLDKHQEMQCLLATRVAVCHEMFVSAPTGGVDTITRQQWIKSRLGWLGIRQRRTTKYLSIPGPRQRKFGHAAENVIEDRHETFLYWQFFGYGFHVSRQYPYGSILPSLRVYPVIKDFKRYEYMMQKSSVVEWQQAFETGALSPFVRTQYGQTLLHVSNVIYIKVY
jgi:hypothetical protein